MRQNELTGHTGMKETMLRIVMGMAVILGMMIFNAMPAHAATKQTFDADYYYNRYPDVAQVYGYDTEALYTHYVNFGIKEGRYGNASEENNTATLATTIPASIGGSSTYVLVDLQAQKVTLVKNGEVALVTPCVTGDVSKNMSTPRGTFVIMQKMVNTRLIGPTWDVHVDYWMRITNNGIGLHDAQWRSTFDGSEYLNNGSKGCVNLPLEATAAIYASVNIGTPVVVY